MHCHFHQWMPVFSVPPMSNLIQSESDSDENRERERGRDDREEERQIEGKDRERYSMCRYVPYTNTPNIGPLPGQQLKVHIVI